jgi:4-amino-4-deoxy-L-arabinose transferase-like glycosyltransferase
MTVDPSHPAGRAPASRPSAVEWCLVVAVFLAGFALRAAWPTRLAVEHFDEGVYASNVFFSGQKRDERYPNQHLYAPPLLPLLIEFAMLIAGPSNVAAISVNIVAGSLTVPLMWWVGRRWFGAAAGLGAATLIAVNDVHIFFSRTALTDVLLVFWLVAAVYLFWEALASSSRLALVASGAATGLAWWTKYNGWLPLAIGIAGVAPWALWMKTHSAGASHFSARDAGRIAATSILKWAIVAATAFLIWSPWLWSLQEKGGYRAVMANHRGYVVGLAGWFESLSRQAAKLAQIDGWPSLNAPLFAALVCLIFARFSNGRSTWNILSENRKSLVALVAVLGVGLVATSSAILGMASLAGIVWYLSRPVPNPGACSPPAGHLAGWLLAAWFVGLSLTTPLYTPYPRLTLPWLAACCLGTGLLVGRIFGRDEPVPWRGGTDAAISNDHQPVGVVVVVLVALACLAPFALRRNVPGWERRTGVAEAVPELNEAIQKSLPDTARADLDSFVVYTYGEPATLFQLRLAGIRWVRAVQDLNFALPEAPPPNHPSFLIVGPRARLTPGFADLFAARKERLRFVQLVPYERSRLVALDEARLDDGGNTGVLELYQIH